MTPMDVMAVCGLMVLAGAVGVVYWGGREVSVPAGGGEPADPPPAGLVARRYLWYLTLAVVAGVGSGVLVAGAGGRLVMRLLAVTAGDAARGRVTQAGEIVGRISVGGTIGFIVFAALFFGFATGALYLLVRRWLPGGRLGGVAYGGLLLVLAATRIEPLHPDNPDFDIVGPGWLAVAAFGGLVVLHGMLVAALAGRYSAVAPLPAWDRRSFVAHAPLALLLPAAPIFVPVVVVGAAAVALSRIRPLTAFLRSRPASLIGRALVVAAALVALPGSVSALVDIAGRGP